MLKISSIKIAQPDNEIQIGQPNQQQAQQPDQRFNTYYSTQQVTQMLNQATLEALRYVQLTPEMLLEIARKRNIQRWAPVPGQSQANEYRYEPRAVGQWISEWKQQISGEIKRDLSQ